MAGIVLTLFFNAYFVALLPGPKVHAFITKTDIVAGEAAGCTIYHLGVASDRALDYLYFNVQFPQDISDYKFSTAGRSKSPNVTVSESAMFTYSRKPDGDCGVKEIGTSEDPDLHVRLAGPKMIDVRVSNTEAIWALGGDVALSTKPTNAPPAKMYTEGYYEYTILGQPVIKRYVFTGQGLSDQK